MCRRGTALLILARTSSITSKLDRFRSLRGFSRTTMSPLFCSVAKSPSSAPSLRDVPATSGSRASIRSATVSWRFDSASDVPPGVK